MKVVLLALLALLGVASARILKASDTQQVIPGRFIVRLKDGVDAAQFVARTSLRRSDGELSTLSDNTQFVYKHLLSGFSASLDDVMLRALDDYPEVDYIEPDGIATTQGQTQTGATWGIARTSTRSTLSGSNYSYLYRSSAGTGTTIYVIDTGINTAHSDFGGRATFGYNAVTGEGNTDGNGHGTHVAGTCGGTQYGVAKRAALVAVKVLSASGSGSWSGVVAGIDWASGNAAQPTRSVINMSLGGGVTQTVDDATARAVTRGVTTVVAAGNSAANACNYSPARVPSAITVAASDVSDRSASFTNFGSCVDVWAPGVSITAPWYTSNTATNTISGTSMASPHVAGLAAYLISEENLGSPAAVDSRIRALSTSGAIANPPSGTANLLVYNNGNGL